ALREIERKLMSIFLVTIVKNDLGAVSARRRDFHFRRVFKHRHEHAHARFAPGERNRLRVVPRRERDDPAALLLVSQRADLVGRAANLERARALQVFTLEEDLFAGDFIKLARADDRSAMYAR